MTIDAFNQENARKYEPAKKLRPLIERVLKANPEGLTFERIISELMKLKDELEKLRIKFIERTDVSISLRSGYFQRETRGRRAIYKIKPS
ncbi:MAG: hypothetical protein KAU07_02610 [Candidatus Andersenbacteria bacterium]|nr:hypothetical protein [Candidatus Andersenbacteria bacterium]